MAGDQQINTFTLQAMRALKRDHERLKRQFWDLQQLMKSLAANTYPPRHYVAKTTSSVTAMTDDPDLPGSGTVQVYQYNTSTEELAQVDGLNVTAYNLAAEAIDNDTWVMVIHDPFGHWWIHFERCNL